LSEGAGVGRLKDADSMAMPEGSTLYDLVNTGIKYSQAAVAVVVRLRRELSLVKSIPVLIAIDQVRHTFLHQLQMMYSFQFFGFFYYFLYIV
jgi:small subunit ribosomal protein S29